ncbi:MAG: hypothetical protein RIR19_316 [Chloroflexota bacterium]|jgi:hypothetical protein
MTLRHPPVRGKEGKEGGICGTLYWSCLKMHDQRPIGECFNALTCSAPGLHHHAHIGHERLPYSNVRAALVRR